MFLTTKAVLDYLDAQCKDRNLLKLSVKHGFSLTERVLQNSNLMRFWLNNKDGYCKKEIKGNLIIKQEVFFEFPYIEPSPDQLRLITALSVTIKECERLIEKEKNSKYQFWLSYYKQLLDLLVCEIYFPLQDHYKLTPILRPGDLVCYKSVHGLLTQREFIMPTSKERLEEMEKEFEQLDERNHPVRKALFFHDSNAYVMQMYKDLHASKNRHTPIKFRSEVK